VAATVRIQCQREAGPHQTKTLPCVREKICQPSVIAMTCALIAHRSSRSYLQGSQSRSGPPAVEGVGTIITPPTVNPTARANTIAKIAHLKFMASAPSRHVHHYALIGHDNHTKCRPRQGSTMNLEQRIRGLHIVLRLEDQR
jgi:hypothetical protein